MCIGFQDVARGVVGSSGGAIARSGDQTTLLIGFSRLMDTVCKMLVVVVRLERGSLSWRPLLRPVSLRECHHSQRCSNSPTNSRAVCDMPPSGMPVRVPFLRPASHKKAKTTRLRHFTIGEG